MRYFTSGLIAGATVSGVIAGILGGFAALVPAGPRWTLFAMLAAVMVAFELVGRPLSLPQSRRAVPQTIIPQSNVVGPLQFGFEMGTGARTFMPTALPHALLAAVVLVGAGGLWLRLDGDPCRTGSASRGAPAETSAVVALSG